MEKAVNNSGQFRIPMKAVLLVIGLIIVLGILIGHTLYNKPHRSVEDENAISITASQLFQEFEENEAEANKKYLNQAVAVSGLVSDISTNQDGKTILVLETGNPVFGVSCTMVAEIENVELHKEVIVKGICMGYLSDVVITQSILLKD